MSKQSFRHVLVTNNIDPAAADAATTALVPGQISVFEVPSYKAKLDFNTISRVQIFQGTPDFEMPMHGGVPNFNRRTIEFNKLAIKAARIKTPVTAQGRILAIGYDNVLTTKTLSLKCGQKKFVTITLSGVPVNQETGHRDGITRTFQIEAPLCADCPTPSDPCVVVPSGPLADDLKAQIERDPLLKKYLQITKRTGTDGVLGPVAGLEIASAVVKRDRTSKYLFGSYPYDADVVHVEINTWSPDYNDSPEVDADQWPITEKQALRYAQGGGEYVRELENRSLSYELQEYSCDPAQLEAYGYEFNAIVGNTYDEYELHVSQSPIKTEGFGSVENDYIISIYIPTGAPGRAVGKIGDVLNKLVVDAGLPALF
jgi:hypothetical protein